MINRTRLLTDAAAAASWLPVVSLLFLGLPPPPPPLLLLLLFGASSTTAHVTVRGFAASQPLDPATVGELPNQNVPCFSMETPGCFKIKIAVCSPASFPSSLPTPSTVYIPASSDLMYSSCGARTSCNPISTFERKKQRRREKRRQWQCQCRACTILVVTGMPYEGSPFTRSSGYESGTIGAKRETRK